MCNLANILLWLWLQCLSAGVRSMAHYKQSQRSSQLSMLGWCAPCNTLDWIQTCLEHDSYKQMAMCVVEIPRFNKALFTKYTFEGVIVINKNTLVVIRFWKIPLETMQLQMLVIILNEWRKWVINRFWSTHSCMPFPKVEQSYGPINPNLATERMFSVAH